MDIPERKRPGALVAAALPAAFDGGGETGAGMGMEAGQMGGGGSRGFVI